MAKRESYWNRIPARYKEGVGNSWEGENEALFRWATANEILVKVSHTPEPGETITMARTLFDAMQDGAVAGHVWREEIIEAFLDLCFFNPEFTPAALMAGSEEGAVEGDAEAPLMSASYLYPLFGKEDARTIRAVVDRIGAAICGGDEAWDARQQAHRRKYWRGIVTMEFADGDALRAFITRCDQDAALMSPPPAWRVTRGTGRLRLLDATAEQIERLNELHRQGDIPEPTVTDAGWRDYLSRRYDERSNRIYRREDR